VADACEVLPVAAPVIAIATIAGLAKFGAVDGTFSPMVGTLGVCRFADAVHYREWDAAAGSAFVVAEIVTDILGCRSVRQRIFNSTDLILQTALPRLAARPAGTSARMGVAPCIMFSSCDRRNRR